MKKKVKNTENNSILSEPMVEYRVQRMMPMPDYIHEDIRIGIEQADQGKLIPFQEVLARYR